MEGTFEGNFTSTPDMPINVRAKAHRHVEEVEVTEYETTTIKETVVGFAVWAKNTFFFLALFICRKTRDIFCEAPSNLVKGKTPLLRIMNKLEVTEREGEDSGPRPPAMAEGFGGHAAGLVRHELRCVQLGDSSRRRAK